MQISEWVSIFILGQIANNDVGHRLVAAAMVILRKVSLLVAVAAIVGRGILLVG
ncbi:MAG: hypothetical protein AB7D37_14095 [Desulfovibrio sp.]